MAAKNLFHRISASINGALPEYMSVCFSQEQAALYAECNHEWNIAEWSSYLTLAERYLHHIHVDNAFFVPGTIDSVYVVSKRLWFLAVFDYIADEGNNLKHIYSQDDLTILEHIQRHSREPSLYQRIRALQFLNTLLHSMLNTLPDVWEINGKRSYEEAEAQLAFIKWQVLLAIFKKYYDRDYKSAIDVANTRRKAFLSCVVRVSACMRKFWTFDAQLGRDLYKALFTNVDFDSSQVFYVYRVLLLLCPNAYIYKVIQNGEFFKIWDFLNGEVVSFWNSMMIQLLCRGAKYGWSIGEGLAVEKVVRLAYLFNVCHNAFGIPSRVTVGRYKESIPGEYTVLLEKPFNLLKKFAKLLVLLLHQPNDDDQVLDYLKALVNTIYPYTHPSSSGKWSSNIASFSRQFVASYVRRVFRQCSVYTCAECRFGNVKLGNEMDNCIIDIFYNLSLQGMHCKNMQVVTCYEDILKRLCLLQPHSLLDPLLQQLLEACDRLTEPHELLASLRVFFQIAGLIIKYAPGALLPILETCLKGIDASDPFKTAQTLTLLNVIFSHVPCRDLSDVIVTDEQVKHYIDNFKLTKDVEVSLEKLSVHGTTSNVACLSYPRDMKNCKVAEDTCFYVAATLAFDSTGTDMDARQALEQILSQRRIVSQNLPSWCIEWFTAVLRLVEQSLAPNMTTDTIMNTVDIGNFILLRSGLTTILSQTDELCFGEICNLYLDWIESNVGRNDSLKHQIAISTCLSLSNPSFVMKHCFTKLLKSFEQQADRYANDEFPEKCFIWYIGCFCGLVRRGALDLCDHLDDIKLVTQVGLNHKSKVAFKYAVKLVQRCIESTLGVYLLPFGSMDQKGNAAANNVSECALFWDVPWYLSKVQHDQLGANVHWHIPSEKEVEFALDLLAHLIAHANEFAKERLEVQMPDFVKGHKVELTYYGSTEYHRISRLIAICKRILKSLKLFVVDERPFQGGVLPRVSPMDLQQVHDTQAFVARVITSLEKLYQLGDAGRDLMVSNVLQKTIGLIDVYLFRHVVLRDSNSMDTLVISQAFKKETGIDTSVTANRGMIQWLSLYGGISKYSHWYDSARVMWLSLVQERVHDRFNIRKMGQKFEHPRSTMSYFIMECAISPYKNLASEAQHLVRGISQVHTGMKSNVLFFIICRGLDIIEMYKDVVVSESLASIPDILHSSCLVRMFSIPTTFGKFVKFITSVVREAANKDCIMNRFDTFFVTFLNIRERLPVCDASRATLRYLLQQLLDPHPSSPGTQHWRFQLYCTCILICFSHVVEESPELQRLYVRWLVEAVDTSSKQYTVSSVSIVGILRAILYQKDSLDAIYIPSVLKNVLQSICMSHYDGAHKSPSSSATCNIMMKPKGNSNGVNTIVMTVLKLERSWPTNRVANNSTAVLLNNMYLIYNLILEAKARNQVSLVVNVIIEKLKELAETPQSVAENHTGFAEIVGGLLKACTCLDKDDFVEVWLSLHPILKQELDSIEQARICDFMDAFRYALDANDLAAVERVRDGTFPSTWLPIASVCINYSAPIDFQALHKCNLNATGTSTLNMAKQLRFYEAMAQQLRHLYPVIYKDLVNVLVDQDGFFHTAPQIRDQIGDIAGLVVGFCCGRGSVDYIANEIHAKVYRILCGLQTEESTSEDATRGMLSILRCLHSPNMPTLCHCHGKIAEYFEFSVRLVRHDNVNISDAAQRTIENMALCNYHGKGTNGALGELVKGFRNMMQQGPNIVRVRVLETAGLLQRNLCMFIRRNDVHNLLLEMYIDGLLDVHTRPVARDCITDIAISAHDQDYLELINRFDTLLSQQNSECIAAGVYGLMALVATAPYHVPTWMPPAVTRLASCASCKFPQFLRSSIQEAIQSFYKSHMDAWTRVHVHKFTREQLDMIEMYKGCPTYFN